MSTNNSEFCAIPSASSGRSAPIRAVHVMATPDTEAAGTSYTVPRLCRSLSQAGADVTLLAIGAPNATFEQRFRYVRFVADWANIPVIRALRASRALHQELRNTAKIADVVHNHGLWLFPNVYAGWVAKETGRPLVVAPRGMLGAAAMQFSRKKKAVFWHLLQKSVVQQAACLHATSEQEYNEIRAAGLRQPVAIVPNGVDLPILAPRQKNRAGLRTVLNLGRLHPKKDLETLIRAWARLEKAHPNWQLRIVGPSEQGYVDKLQALAAAEKLQHVIFEGPLFGQEKLAAYRTADLFVLPTLNENFAMTVAEALAAEVPVIASKGAPWAGLQTEGCGWWVNLGVEPLANALADAMTSPIEELRAMGSRGRLWMNRDFSWEPIGLKMLQVYEWLVRAARPPSFVEFK